MYRSIEHVKFPNFKPEFMLNQKSAYKDFGAVSQTDFITSVATEVPVTSCSFVHVLVP